MKSHRPPLKRCATKDGMGGRRCSWGLNTIRRGRCQGRRRPRPARFRAHLWVSERPKICVGFDQAAARSTREIANKRRQAMALLGLGYAGFGSADARRLAAVRHRPGRPAGGRARQFAAGVPDGRPQAAHRRSTARWPEARASSAGRSRTRPRWMRWRRGWKRPACRSRPNRGRWPMPGASAA